MMTKDGREMNYMSLAHALANPIDSDDGEFDPEDMYHPDEVEYKKPEALTDTQEAISTACDEVKDMLIAKNKAYGNSALEPVRIFSKADKQEQLRVRIDDKLSRLMRGSDAGEDVVLDLIGYLVLLRVAGKEQNG